MADDQAARRAFWAKKMDEARDFVLAILDEPVVECGEPFADMQQAAVDADVEVRFSATLNGGKYPRVYQLRQGLIDSYLAVARDMNERGWVLKVEDGYRSRDMQRNLARTPELFRTILASVRWELDGDMPSAEFLTERVGALIACAPKVGTHMSGSAIDISVLDRDTGEEIDRGAPYLEMSELTPMDSPFVSPTAQANRKAITALLASHGFVAYPWEFWHYNQGDAHDVYLSGIPGPARYGAVDWDPATNHITSITDPNAPLNDDADIRAQIEKVLAEG